MPPADRPSDRAAIDSEGWFHSGDVGYVDEEGFLFICDRLKDMVISGGENVYPAEVEGVLYRHEHIAEVAVLGLPDEKWGESVLALVVLRAGAALNEEQVIAYTKTKLAGYKCPKRVEFRTELARTATGKLQKFKLRAPYWEGRERQVN